MLTTDLEPILEEAERRAVLMVLRAHPEWTLGYLLSQIEHDGRRASVVRELTLGELLSPADSSDEVLDLILDLETDQPPIDHRRLAAAKRVDGPRFDAFVRDVLGESYGRPVAASYLRARVGGPRWKLQGSLRRLVDAGVVERTGTTSATRYRAVSA